MVTRTRFGNIGEIGEEKRLLGCALDIQDLWPYKYGKDKTFNFMKEAINAVCDWFEIPDKTTRPYMVPTASGTASIHVALGGLQIRAGTEVIVPPITDIGTITPLLFHNTIPVFADVDRDSGLITPETVKEVVTDRTSAVVAVHLTGSPVDVPGIREMLDKNGHSRVKIIEDVAQGLGANLDGVPLGMLGDAGCFSLNSQKHITVGEGGFVLLRDHEDYLRCHSYSDKHRNRLEAGTATEHGRYKGIGHSLRMSQLQGAMLMGQLPRLEGFAKRRNEFGLELDRLMETKTKLIPQSHLEESYPTFFMHMFALKDELDKDPKVAAERKEKIRKAVKAELAKLGLSRITTSYNEWDLPIYQYPLFLDKNFSVNSPYWPAALVAEKETSGKITSDSYKYTEVNLPEAESYLRRSFTFSSLHEGYTKDHAMQMIDALIAGFKNAGHPINK